MQSHGWFSLLVISLLLYQRNGSYRRFRLTYRGGEAGLESIQCYSSKGLKQEREKEKGKSWNERSLKETKKNCCLWGAMYFLQGVFLLDNLWDGGTRYLNLCFNTGKGRRKQRASKRKMCLFSGETIYLFLKKKRTCYVLLIIMPSANGLLNSNVFFCWEANTWPWIIFFFQPDNAGGLCMHIYIFIYKVVVFRMYLNVCLLVGTVSLPV